MSYEKRDEAIKVNSYTTVLRRPGVPHERFAAYWRDVHGPLCSRLPGLGWYVQHHFAREQEAHLWPSELPPIPDYVLDGAVEIGFGSARDQKTFTDASPLLFSDEQNVFQETVNYVLPQGSRTYLDRLEDPTPNESGGLDRLHVHFHAGDGDFGAEMEQLAARLAGEAKVLKVRLHLPEPPKGDDPPAPDVQHHVPPPRVRLAMLELAFANPLERRRVLQPAVVQTKCVARVSAFAVSGVYTFVRDGQLTTAGLRGSRPAELIRELGALNQVSQDVEHLMHTGKMP